MSRINEMTMSEILEEAEKRGFDPSPWSPHCWYSWNSGMEVAAIKFLERHAQDLYEEEEEEEDE